MDEVPVVTDQSAVVTRDTVVSFPTKRVKRKPVYHRGKLIGFRIVGHTSAVGFMVGASVVYFFPPAAIMILNGYDPNLVLAVSSLTVVARFSLGYVRLMIPTVERTVKSAAEIKAVDETEESRRNRVALRKKNAVKIPVLIVISTPFVSLFSMAAYYSIEKFQEQVANQTATNATRLLDVFFQVANATESPAVKGVLVGCTGAFNLLANVLVLTAPIGILIARKQEYIVILLNPEGLRQALRRYRMAMNSGWTFWLVAGTLGNLTYFPFSGLMFNRYWYVPVPVGYLLGAFVFANLMLLAHLVLEPLIKLIMEEAVDRWRGVHQWPSYPQIAFNLLMASAAGFVVACSAAFAVFVAEESHVNPFFVVVSAVLLGLLEWPAVYYVLKLPEFGIRTLLGRPSKEQLAYQKQNQAQEEERVEEKVQVTDSDSPVNGDLRRSSSMESPVEGLVGTAWEDSGRSITPPKPMKRSAEDFKGQTPDTSEESSEEKLSWRAWMRETFFFCGRRESSSKVVVAQTRPLKTSTSGLLELEREARQIGPGQVTSGIPQGYQGTIRPT